MSTNSHSSSRSNTLSKSATYSQTFEDDEISDTSINKEDYGNESFEDDSQDEESGGEMSLGSLEGMKEPQKPGSFVNKTFTAKQIREIERENAILMNKILTYSKKPVKPAMRALPNRYHLTSSAINRKKNQMKIDWENQILLKKIQSAKPAVKY